MKRFCLYFASLMVLFGIWIDIGFAQSEETWMPDDNLRAAVRDALSLNSGTALTKAAVGTLTVLNASQSSISDLTGLEHASSLTGLNLNDNSISDLSKLAGLTSLTSLSLNENQISSISNLKGLTNLTGLSLE